MLPSLQSVTVKDILVLGTSLQSATAGQSISILLEEYYEIVPDVTAALAAAASLKQPLTKRGIARSVSLFTCCIATSCEKSSNYTDL